MIGQLRGLIVCKKGEKIILDIHGVGYEVIVPASFMLRIPDIGKETELKIYTHVREESLQLFGFLTEFERETFLLLISVTGIGPRAALTILSEVLPEELRNIIISKNEQRLVTIPGIGKKTAERLIMELKDKIIKLSLPEYIQTGQAEKSEIFSDLTSALGNLGYKPSEIDRVVQHLRHNVNRSHHFPELLKQSLKILRS